MRRVIVHVDRLVLRGIAPEQKHAIADGLRRELGRVFGERGVVEGLRERGEVERVRVEGVSVERSVPAEVHK